MNSGILLIDKAPGWTSHDVVAKCRGILQQKSIGHAGTLDPMATGLLVLFTGRGTKAIPYFPGDKAYTASFRFGFDTDTQDITGQVTQAYGFIPSSSDIKGILPKFTGEIYQIPPMVSAVKVNGQRLYKLARKGLEVERKPRLITIFSFEYLGDENGEHTIAVACSSGTYVRTLIYDIGHALGSGAAMTSLRRTRSGPYLVSQSCSVAEASSERVLPLDSLFKDLPAITLSGRQAILAKNGGGFPAKGVCGFCRVYDENGEFLLLGRVEGGVGLTEKSFYKLG
ncbi:MAG: tRNA pseudouridine(55) synthase TruB [Oscillospiraceae bacterium]|nr:tRNA pseudouridine(55) synthase TruB [Oscillospiraceae bacterium]